MIKNKKPLFLLLMLLTSISIFQSCKKNITSQQDSFDRKAMLQNYADNLIKPAFTDLQTQTNALKTATDLFTNAPDETKLNTLKAAFDNAYSSFMYANAYNFGPAGEDGIKKGFVEEIGTWPANTQIIEANIIANNTSLSDFKRDNRGFNALDYLINNFKTSDYLASPNRKLYLQAVANKIKTEVDYVTNKWNGEYYNTFLNNTGTDVGSSTAQLYNEFVSSFEIIKNYKLGLPMGKRAGQTNAEPLKVEALYNKQSLKYLKLNLTALNNIWLGKGKNGSDGVGFKNYLNNVAGGSDLVLKTEAQLKVIYSVLNDIPINNSLESQISSNFSSLDKLYTELQKHTRYYKSDMSSLLGIAITFSSNDGD